MLLTNQQQKELCFKNIFNLNKGHNRNKVMEGFLCAALRAVPRGTAGAKVAGWRESLHGLRLGHAGLAGIECGDPL